ncbi:MAG: DUF3971 domain-containing protein, partial [Pseudomonadota bacterium]
MVPLIDKERIKVASGKTKALSVACGKACHRAGIWAVRATAIASGFFSTLVIVLFSMLGADGFSLGIIRPAVEGAIVERTGASAVSVGRVHLVRDQKGEAPFLLTVTNIEVDRGDKGNVDIPELALRLDAGNLMRGQMIPHYVEVSGAQIFVERQGQDFSIGSRTETGDSVDIVAVASAAKEAGFKGAVLRDVDLRYENHINGATFSTVAHLASLTLDEEGYAFQVSLPRDTQSMEDSVSLSIRINDQTGDVEAIVTAVEAPADQLLPLFVGEDETISLSSHVSGQVRAVGGVRSGIRSVDVDLSVGEGVAMLRGYEILVQELTLLGNLKPDEGVMSVEELSYQLSEGEGVVAGEVRFLRASDQLSAVTFDLSGQNIVSNGMGLMPEPLPVKDGHFTGRFAIDDRVLSLDTIDADYFGARLGGKISFSFPLEEGDSIGLSADIVVDGEIDPKQVLRGWPPSLGDGARRWVAANLIDGDIYDVVYKMDIPRGAIAEGAPLTPEKLDLVFRAKNATIIYVPGMTPVTDVVATGHISGNSFTVNASGGRVGKIRLLGSKIQMDKLVPKGNPAVFDIQAAGEISDILT